MKIHHLAALIGGAASVVSARAFQNDIRAEDLDAGVVLIEALQTSTIYTTSVFTVTACGSNVTNCPLEGTTYVTSVVATTTTVCPVTMTSPLPAPNSGQVSTLPSTSVAPGTSAVPGSSAFSSTVGHSTLVNPTTASGSSVSLPTGHGPPVSLGTSSDSLPAPSSSLAASSISSGYTAPSSPTPSSAALASSSHPLETSSSTSAAVPDTSVLASSPGSSKPISTVTEATGTSHPSTSSAYSAPETIGTSSFKTSAPASTGNEATGTSSPSTSSGYHAPEHSTPNPPGSTATPSSVSTPSTANGPIGTASSNATLMPSHVSSPPESSYVLPGTTADSPAQSSMFNSTIVYTTTHITGTSLVTTVVTMTAPIGSSGGSVPHKTAQATGTDIVGTGVSSGFLITSSAHTGNATVISPSPTTSPWYQNKGLKVAEAGQSWMMAALAAVIFAHFG